MHKLSGICMFLKFAFVQCQLPFGREWRLDYIQEVFGYRGFVLSIAVSVKTTAFVLRIKPQYLLLSLFLLEFFNGLAFYQSRTKLTLCFR